MDAKRHYQLRQELNDEGVVFCYNGYLTENLLVGIGDVLKRRLSAEDVDKKTIRSVFHFFVEQVQNIIRYSLETHFLESGAPDIGYGLVIVGSKDDKHFVTCANLMESHQVDKLREHLDRLSALSKEELKKLYKAELKKEEPNSELGAGLGIIDIARRADSITYSFSEVEEGNIYFSLTSYL